MYHPTFIGRGLLVKVHMLTHFKIRNPYIFISHVTIFLQYVTDHFKKESVPTHINRVTFMYTFYVLGHQCHVSHTTGTAHQVIQSCISLKICINSQNMLSYCSTRYI
jgi:hypothetical protein